MSSWEASSRSSAEREDDEYLMSLVQRSIEEIQARDHEEFSEKESATFRRLQVRPHVQITGLEEGKNADMVPCHFSLLPPPFLLSVPSFPLSSLPFPSFHICLPYLGVVSPRSSQGVWGAL